MSTAVASIADKPQVPVGPWRPGRKARLQEAAMRAVARFGGACSDLTGSRADQPLGILAYHRVAPQTPGVPAPPYNATPRAFRAQLTGLLKRGYRFISLSSALRAHHSGEPLPSRSVVLTFDDCFETVFTEAFPILQELGTPATLLLCTGYLDGDKPFPFDTWAFEYTGRVPRSHYRPIQIQQCESMLASGLIEIGTHTHTHADFRGHSEAFLEEMEVSAEIVQRSFGVDAPPFSFPFGTVADGLAGPELMEAARSTTACCALTTEVELVDPARDPFGWGRITVFDWDTGSTLAGKLGGWYDWAPRLKHRLKQRQRAGRSPR
ncbi:MAG: polysaccharide deacetylase family protein [Planctomycetota bacterium]